MDQRTIREEISFSGKALQTGACVSVVCRPAGTNSGIVFKRTDLSGRPQMNLNDAVFSAGYARRSAVGVGDQAVQTVEHFLAALWSLGIDNISIEINGEELPALDGSAIEFVDLLKEAGLFIQPEPKNVIKITETALIKERDASISVIPDEDFKVSYLIDYDVASIGREVFDIKLDQESFEREIAPARTFCLKKEADALLRAGLGKGATLDNTLVLDEDGPVGGAVMRFPNEPVRHKILDLVGDLYMLGRPVIGRIVAERSGHHLNAQMVRLLYEKYVR